MLMLKHQHEIYGSNFLDICHVYLDKGLIILLLDSYIWRGIKLTRIESSLRKAMTQPCIKIPVEADSAIELALS